MTYRYSVNNGYNGAEMGPYPLFDLKTLMKAHGWTVTRSSNGTLFGAADYITTATDLTSQYSWMVLHNTGTGREWLFGMDADVTYYEWYVGYSANIAGAGGFTGGTATAMPTATDEAAVLGPRASAPKALFSYEQGYFVHVMVDDASDAFYLIAVNRYYHNICTCIVGDPLTQTHASDADPYVAIAMYYSKSSNYTIFYGPWGTTGSNYSRAWYNYPGGSAERISVLQLTFGASTSGCIAPAQGAYNGGPNHYDGKDGLFPVLYGRTINLGAPYGFKGVSTLFRNVSTVRAGCDTLTVGTEKWILTGSKDYSNAALPWPLDPKSAPR